MLTYNLKYIIENKYEAKVKKANYQLLVIPETNKSQNIDKLVFQSSSERVGYVSLNMYGFKTINYFIDKPFDTFTFEMNMLVEKTLLNPFNFLPLSAKEEFEIINSFSFFLEHHLFLKQTNLTEISSKLANYFPLYSASIQVFDYLQTLNKFIYDFLEYVPLSTTTETKIQEILDLKKGVCQDYAHLFIAICRKNKIPVRYVSGYLDQGANHLGSSQLHAWVEAFVPIVGWLGFDPTNNLLIDHHYVNIAHGTDYNDCSPIIGVLDYAGAQKSMHLVSITNQ